MESSVETRQSGISGHSEETPWGRLVAWSPEVSGGRSSLWLTMRDEFTVFGQFFSLFWLRKGQI